jgi:hypothetical protein
MENDYRFKKSRTVNGCGGVEASFLSEYPTVCRKGTEKVAEHTSSEKKLNSRPTNKNLGC